MAPQVSLQDAEQPDVRAHATGIYRTVMLTSIIAGAIPAASR